jgi:hypothetical protein
MWYMLCLHAHALAPPSPGALEYHLPFVCSPMPGHQANRYGGERCQAVAPRLGIPSEMPLPWVSGQWIARVELVGAR